MPVIVGHADHALAHSAPRDGRGPRGASGISNMLLWRRACICRGTMISRLARSKAFTLLLACAGCSSTGGTRATGSTASTPCDPLTPPPTTLGPILGVGQDTQSILYVAAEAPDGGGQQRVFVSSGTTLDRQHVLGSGSTPGQDSFSFEAPFADAGGARTLFIENPGGAVTAMALGSGSLRAPLAADAGETPLAVVDAGVVAAFEVQNLPAVVEHVG